MPTKTPRFGDQDDVGLYALERGLDLHQHGRTHQVGKIETETVHSVGLDEVPTTVDDQSRDHCRRTAQVIATPTPIGQLALVVLLKVIKPVDKHQMSRLANVIVNHVQHHRHPSLMEGMHKVLKFLHSAGLRGIGRVAAMG